MTEHQASRDYSVIKYRAEHCEETRDKVAVEYPFTLYLNKQTRAFHQFYATPQDLPALVIGNLRSREIITNVEDIEGWNWEADGALRVQLREGLTASCHSHSATQKTEVPVRPKKNPPVPWCLQLSRGQVGAAELYTMMEEFTNKSLLFQETGSLHSAALFDGQDLWCFAEDVSRENAVDKTLGKMLLQGIQSEGKALVTSARVSYKLMQKARALDLKVVISKSAPSSLAIDLARQYQMQLVGFVRAARLNLYT